MAEYFLIIVFGIAGVMALFHYLLHQYKKKIYRKNEVRKFYRNMRKLALAEWEIAESLKRIKTYKELKQININLEFSIKTYNL